MIESADLPPFCHKACLRLLRRQPLDFWRLWRGGPGISGRSFLSGDLVSVELTVLHFGLVSRKPEEPVGDRGQQVIRQTRCRRKYNFTEKVLRTEDILKNQAHPLGILFTNLDKNTACLGQEF